MAGIRKFYRLVHGSDPVIHAYVPYETLAPRPVTVAFVEVSRASPTMPNLDNETGSVGVFEHSVLSWVSHLFTSVHRIESLAGATGCREVGPARSWVDSDTMEFQSQSHSSLRVVAEWSVESHPLQDVGSLSRIMVPDRRRRPRRRDGGKVCQPGRKWQNFLSNRFDQQPFVRKTDAG